MVVPEDAVEVREATDSAAQDLQSVNIEHACSTPPFVASAEVTVIATPLREAGGSMLWHGIFMDTTERKRAGERLRASSCSCARPSMPVHGHRFRKLNARTLELDPTARRIWELDSRPIGLKFEQLATSWHRIVALLYLRHWRNWLIAAAKQSPISSATAEWQERWWPIALGLPRWVTGALVGAGWSWMSPKALMESSGCRRRIGALGCWPEALPMT